VTHNDTVVVDTISVFLADTDNIVMAPNGPVMIHDSLFLDTIINGECRYIASTNYSVYDAQYGLISENYFFSFKCASDAHTYNLKQYISTDGTIYKISEQVTEN